MRGSIQMTELKYLKVPNGIESKLQIKRLPEYDYLYYGDEKNNPYGEKTEEELIQITSDIVRNFQKRGCKLIVIACNTATTRCMKKLREMFPEVIFVGTVPAIKVACDKAAAKIPYYK